MEDNKNEFGHSEDCHKHGGYGMCGICGHGHRHFLLRLLLGLVILAVVFGLGVKIGEFKGEFAGGYGSYYGHHRMMYKGGSQDGWGMMDNYGAMPMMRSATTTPQK